MFQKSEHSAPGLKALFVNRILRGPKQNVFETSSSLVWCPVSSCHNFRARVEEKVLTTAAKAAVYMHLCGTAEAVPFQVDGRTTLTLKLL